MTTRRDRGPDQVDADRHRQLHRLPGVPGGLQAVERAGRRGDRAGGPSWASRTRRRSARRRTRSSRSTRWRTRRSREAWNPPSSCSGASTAWSRPASPPARRRRSTGRPTVRCRTTSTSASAAATACWRVPGTCRPRNGTRAPRRSRSARTAPTAPISRCRSRSTGSRCPTTRASGSPETIATPACVKACPADALRYGTREEMLALAHKRIADRPDKYVDHVYGEKELGGTSVLYLSAVPFEKLGFPTYGEKPFPAFTKTALGAVPPAVMAVGALLGAAYAFFRKRAQAVADGSAAAKHSARPRPRRIRAPPEQAADPVQLGPPPAHGVRRRLVGRALRPGARRQHQPLRHLPVGPVDPLRPGVDRGGRGRVRDGRRDLCLPAQGSLRAGPHRRPDGPPELLLRDGHSPRRPRPALALLPARPERAGALGHVRGLVVRRPLRHDPPARVPAGALRALGIPAGRGGAGGDGTAPTWRRR